MTHQTMSSSKCVIPARDSMQPIATVCSNPSTRRSRMEWAWGLRSAARLSRPMADGYGRSRTNHLALSFALRCRSPRAIDTAILFKERAAQAGIEVNVIREPDDGYWTDVWLKKPFVMCFWGGRPTEDWMFIQVYAKDAPWNDTHWKNQRFNQLLVDARPELDENKRRALYHEMQLILCDEGGAIVPMYANFVFARSTKVARDEAIAANWELDGWKCIERWWFA